MSVVLITGSAGLIGAETARWFHDHGFDVVGIDNTMSRAAQPPLALLRLYLSVPLV